MEREKDWNYSENYQIVIKNEIAEEILDRLVAGLVLDLQKITSF
jgi:hypothetical protein